MTKRGKYLVKKGLQAGLTARFLLVTVLFSMFVGFEVFITIWPVVSEAIPRETVPVVIQEVIFRLCFFALPLVFVIAAFSLVFSHRIAGPVYRLEQTLDRLVQGEKVAPLEVRKHDDLKGLVRRINILIQRVGEPEKPPRPEEAGE